MDSHCLLVLCGAQVPRYWLSSRMTTATQATRVTLDGLLGEQVSLVTVHDAVWSFRSTIWSYLWIAGWQASGSLPFLVLHGAPAPKNWYSSRLTNAIQATWVNLDGLLSRGNAFFGGRSWCNVEFLLHNMRTSSDCWVATSGCCLFWFYVGLCFTRWLYLRIAGWQAFWPSLFWC